MQLMVFGTWLIHPAKTNPLQNNYVESAKWWWWDLDLGSGCRAIPVLFRLHSPCARKPCCPEDFFLSLAKSFLWIFRSMHNFRVHFELLPLQIPGIEPSSSQVERFVKITTAILLPELLPDGCFKKSYKTGSNCEKCMRGRIRPAKSELWKSKSYKTYPMGILINSMVSTGSNFCKNLLFCEIFYLSIYFPEAK